MQRALLSLSALCLLVASYAGAQAQAQGRPLELLFGDMTPSPSRTCMREMARQLRLREHQPLSVTRWGERTMRRAVGDEEGAFLEWTMEELRPLLERRRSTPFDAIALVDCRETERSAQMLVLSAAGEIARISFRSTTIDDARTEWLTRTLLMHAWDGRRR